MKVYKVLAGMDFSGKLFEASAQTALGNELLTKYRTIMVANPASCGIVNQFLKEARNLSYDNGITKLVGQIAEVLEANHYGWALASVCEGIANGRSNYLSLRAAEQVAPMLEMDESSIVSYIKSGALKNVMYVEQFRNIARSIFREQPIVEYSDRFQTVHPISMVVEKDGTYYFSAGGYFFRTNDNEISNVSTSAMDNEFLTVTKLLESGFVKYNDGALVMEYAGRTYTIAGDDEPTCTVSCNGNNTEYTVAQLRENNNYLVGAAPINQKAQRAQVLESFAKVYENFANIAILNNVSLINSSNDSFLVIENHGNAYAKLLRTNHGQAWELQGDITKVCEDIKRYTQLDITKVYESAIGTCVEEMKEKEGQKIQENLEQSEVEKRRQQIRELTEKFKNDPTRLAMLSEVAAELNKIQ